MGLFGVSPFFYENLYYACGGNGHKHTQDAAELSEDRNRNQHKYRMEAYGVADNFRINVIAVKLLNYEQSNESCETSQQAAGDISHQDSGNHTEKRPEIGNYVQNAGQYADDNCKFYLEN